MKNLILFLLFALVACQPNPEQQVLTLIPADETVERVKAGNFDYSKAVFKNETGNDLSESERDLLNEGKLAKDFYEDQHQAIREVRVRPSTLADKFIDIQRRELSVNPFNGIPIIDIDCDNLAEIYEEVYFTDQDVRNNGGDMEEVDRRNQQIVISALTKCGWHEDYLQTIWIVFQHSEPAIMTYYYPTLKKFSEEGKLSKSAIALMEDRLLMNHGYKQIYGSQIRSDGLYDLEDPENVNTRRAEVGLGTIEEYLTHWDLDFEEEKERMKDL